MSVAGCGIALGKVLAQGIAYTETMTRNLVGICRADALACRTYLTAAHGALAGGIEKTVCRHYQMCLFRYFENRVEIDAIGLELLGLATEKHRVENDTITYHIGYGSLGEHARGNGAEHMLVSVEFECVSGVGAALETGYHIVLGSEDIDNLALAFVAPLQA